MSDSKITQAQVQDEGKRLVYEITHRNGAKQVYYLEAGELAVLGRSGPARYDGLVREEGKRG